MLTIANALIPVMVIILLGVFLKRIALFSDETWSGFGNLCYFVLFPALLIKTLATAEVESGFLFDYIIMVMSVILIKTSICLLSTGSRS